MSEMTTQEKAERIINGPATAKEIREVAQAYLNQRQEIEELKETHRLAEQEWMKSIAEWAEANINIRNQALEEAAKVAEGDDTDCENSEHHTGCIAGYYIAIAIRALKDN